MRFFVLIWVVFLALPAVAQEAYLDDRSTPEAVVASLYDAINAGDFARAWSYFHTDHAPSFSAYRSGFEDTDHVTAHLGPAAQLPGDEGQRWQVPVVLEAAQQGGDVALFSGCYLLGQDAPRRRPPYAPIAILSGHFHRVDGPVAELQGDCDWD